MKWPRRPPKAHTRQETFAFVQPRQSRRYAADIEEFALFAVAIAIIGGGLNMSGMILYIETPLNPYKQDILSHRRVIRSYLLATHSPL
jgi:hypothetical protein